MSTKYLNLEFWFYQIYLLLKSAYEFLIADGTSPLWSIVNIILEILILIFLCLLIYSSYKILKIRKKETGDFMASFVSASEKGAVERQEWQDILDHTDSDNEPQWKLALIEADKILEELLTGAGYNGEGIGEKLKDAESRGGLRSLQEAWSAHKVRNQIAHESGFVLSKREAKKAVESYKKVFEELGFFQ